LWSGHQRAGLPQTRGEVAARRRDGSGTAVPGLGGHRRLTEATAGAPERGLPVMSCGAGALYLGWIRAVCPWARGEARLVRADKASRGPPALAYRHRLDLRGERARSMRAAGFPGGRHGPRLDRASPGSPHHGRKPPARHPQLAGHIGPCLAAASAQDRFPAPARGSQPPDPRAVNVLGKLPMLPGPATKDALIQVRGRDADDASNAEPAHCPARMCPGPPGPDRGTRHTPTGLAARGGTVGGPRFRWP
jgi:hypothetical protein